MLWIVPRWTCVTLRTHVGFVHVIPHSCRSYSCPVCCRYGLVARLFYAVTVGFTTFGSPFTAAPYVWFPLYTPATTVLRTHVVTFYTHLHLRLHLVTVLVYGLLYTPTHAGCGRAVLVLPLCPGYAPHTHAIACHRHFTRLPLRYHAPVALPADCLPHFACTVRYLRLRFTVGLPLLVWLRSLRLPVTLPLRSLPVVRFALLVHARCGSFVRTLVGSRTPHHARLVTLYAFTFWLPLVTTHTHILPHAVYLFTVYTHRTLRCWLIYAVAYHTACYPVTLRITLYPYTLRFTRLRLRFAVTVGYGSCTGLPVFTPTVTFGSFTFLRSVGFGSLHTAPPAAGLYIHCRLRTRLLRLQHAYAPTHLLVGLRTLPLLVGLRLTTTPQFAAPHAHGLHCLCRCGWFRFCTLHVTRLHTGWLYVYAVVPRLLHYGWLRGWLDYGFWLLPLYLGYLRLHHAHGYTVG